MNKKLISVAVGGALTVGVSLPALADHDPYLLVPYVVKDTNRTTLVTLVGDGTPVSSGPSIHLQYWTKSTTDANTAACLPNSTTMTFTQNDVVTFDTAGLLGPGPLFGDITNNAPNGSSISYAGPRHGYLLVQNIGSFAARGFWLEVDLANGGAHGDILPGTTDANFADAIQNNFSLRPGNVHGRRSPAVFWPTSLATSAFTVTPLGTDMLTRENNLVVLQVMNNNDVQGAYDRNENGIDGTVPQTVRCVGRLTAAQLMPGVVGNAAWAAQGGWGFLTNLGNNTGATNEACGTTGDCRAMVYQVDSSSAAGAGKFMQNAFRITSDND